MTLPKVTTGNEITVNNVTGSELPEVTATGSYITVTGIAGGDIAVTFPEMTTGIDITVNNITGSDITRNKLLVVTLQKVTLPETMLPKVKIPSVTLPEVAVTGREITGNDITVRDITESDITGSGIIACDMTGSDIFIDVFNFNSVLVVPHIYIYTYIYIYIYIYVYILFVNHYIKFHVVLLNFRYFLRFISIMYFLFNYYHSYIIHSYINFISYYCTYSRPSLLIGLVSRPRAKSDYQRITDCPQNILLYFSCFELTMYFFYQFCA